MQASILLKLLFLIAVILGHGGFWLACFNRINATALPRTLIKIIEKSFIVACLSIPLLFAWHSASFLLDWLWSPGFGLSPVHALWWFYFTGSLISLGVLAPSWLWSRWELSARSPNVIAQRSCSHDFQRSIPDLYRSSKAKWLGRLPFNEIGKVELSEKRIRHSHLDLAWHGLKIAHLSDIHLTGDFNPSFQRGAMEWIQQKKPDLIILSGDIVDYEEELPCLEKVMEPLSAPLGKYFLLGNHDRRLNDPGRIRRELERLGWLDLGSKEYKVEVAGNYLRLFGTEWPWFGSVHPLRALNRPMEVPYDPKEFRIAISHTPDQWPWASRAQAHWMLAGHTHGGQVRLPLFGPIVAPSWYGTQLSSGVFQRGETILHVSRGLSGVHLLRWRCLPEISLLIVDQDDSEPNI